MDLDFVSVHKHAKKELGQYPVILTSRLVNNPYVCTLIDNDIRHYSGHNVLNAAMTNIVVDKITIFS